MEPIIDRLAILSKIKQMVGDNSEGCKVEEIMRSHNLQDALIFCFEDGDLLLDANFRQREYKHKDHTSDRAYIFSPTTKWEFMNSGELRHYTVGAILWKQDNIERQYCLFRRRTHPIGQYTIPAGHLEMNEHPEMAVLREIYEETQLSVLSTRYLWEEELEDECRRGANYHYWYLYLCQSIGEPRISDEADVIGWYTCDEILNKLQLTTSTDYLLRKFFVKHKREIECG